MKSDKSNKYDNSELLRRAALDRQLYYKENEERELEEKRMKLAENEWEEDKRRMIIDLEDSISAIESTNSFLLKQISKLYNLSEQTNRQEIDQLRERVEDNQNKITQLRIQIDELRFKKRP